MAKSYDEISTHVTDLEPAAAEIIHAQIDEIRAQAEALFDPERPRAMKPKNASIMKALLALSEEGKSATPHWLIEQIPSEKIPEDMDDLAIRRIIAHLVRQISINSRTKLAIYSQKHPEYIKAHTYYLGLKESREEDKVLAQKHEMIEPIDLPVSIEKKEELIKRLDKALFEVGSKSKLHKMVLKSLLHATQKDKATTIEYSWLSEHSHLERNHPIPEDQPFERIAHYTSAFYKFKKTVNNHPERYGFQIINNPETRGWQAILIENDNYNKNENSTEPTTQEDGRQIPELSVLVKDSIRHLETSQRLNREKVEFLCNFVLEVSEKNQWTKTNEILRHPRTKELGITSKLIHIFMGKIREITSTADGHMALGYSIERKGEELFRFKRHTEYRKALVKCTERGAIFPVKVTEGIRFNEDYYDETMGLWIKTGKSEKTPTALVMSQLAQFAKQNQALTIHHLAYLTKLPIKIVKIAIKEVKQLIQRRGWAIERGYISKKGAFYLTTKAEAEKQPLAPKEKIKKAVAEAFDSTDPKDMPNKLSIESLISQKETTISPAKQATIHQLAQIMAPQISEKTRRDRTLNGNASGINIASVLKELFIERLTIVIRLRDSKRHITTPVNKAKKQFLLDFLSKKAARGETFTSAELKAKAQAQGLNMTNDNTKSFYERLKEITKTEPRVLGFKLETPRPGYYKIVITKNYRKATVSYKQGYTTYPERIKDPQFKFDKAVYKTGIEKLTAKRGISKEALIRVIANKIAGYSAQGLTISSRLLVQETSGATSANVRSVIKYLRDRFNNEGNIPIEFCQDKDFSFYIRTTGGTSNTKGEKTTPPQPDTETSEIPSKEASEYMGGPFTQEDETTINSEISQALEPETSTEKPGYGRPKRTIFVTEPLHFTGKGPAPSTKFFEEFIAEDPLPLQARPSTSAPSSTTEEKPARPDFSKFVRELLNS
ncbi:hypothetical protein HOE67_04025 [Candidatus Peregrinibacteria bacterium]|jgi:hypothetical protein|nr:hypothetical protein [Candidatus Peregrinibacteria bacterium]MBT4056253.1 hypothetical protein [Candidatus Peregrinibacteria bacterium]